SPFDGACSLCIVHCTLFTAHCSHCSPSICHCPLSIPQCSLFVIHRPLFSSSSFHCSVAIAHRLPSLPTAHFYCSLFAAHSSLFSAYRLLFHFPLLIAHCSLHSVTTDCPLPIAYIAFPTSSPAVVSLPPWLPSCRSSSSVVALLLVYFSFCSSFTATAIFLSARSYASDSQPASASIYHHRLLLIITSVYLSSPASTDQYRHPLTIANVSQPLQTEHPMSYLNRSIADSGSRQPRLARVDNHAAAIDLMDADVDYVDYVSPSSSLSSSSPPPSSSSPHPSPSSPSAIRRHNHNQHNHHSQHNHHNNHGPASLSPAAGRSDRLGRTLDQTVLDSKARQVEFIQDDVKALAAHANAVQLDHAIFRRRAGLVWKAGGFLLALLLALAVAELALVVRISSTLTTLNTLAAMNQSAGAHLTTTPSASASASASVSVSAAPSISSSGSATSSTPSSTSTAATASTSSQPTNTALTMVPGVTVDGTVTSTASS
ncbi:hypothetical protein GQ42DRAFT_92525, partial [Ramicandelaber brevisporus]